MSYSQTASGAALYASPRTLIRCAATAVQPSPNARILRAAIAASASTAALRASGATRATS